MLPASMLGDGVFVPDNAVMSDVDLTFADMQHARDTRSNGAASARQVSNHTNYAAFLSLLGIHDCSGDGSKAPQFSMSLRHL